MLTLEKIKEIRRFTDDIEVLRAAMNLNNSEVQYITRIYDMLINLEIKPSAEYSDIVVKNYITQRLIASKISIEKLVESIEFKHKLPNLTEEELAKYMELCDSDSNNDLITNTTILANYSAKDHFALIEMGKTIKTKQTEIKDIFFAGIENKCPVDTIRIIIKSIDTHLTPVNKGEIARLLTSGSFYDLYSNVDMVEVITGVLSLETVKDIKVLVNVALSGAWKNAKYSIKFSQIAELAKLTSETNQLLLEKEATYELDYEDIVEMLDITKKASHLTTLFTNDFVRENMSHEQMVSLIEEFDLASPENFDAYATALSIIIQMGIKESLYQDLRTGLAKEVYETTVGEYLATCTSISQFIETLSRECKDTDPIGTNTGLNLKLK